MKKNRVFIVFASVAAFIAAIVLHRFVSGGDYVRNGVFDEIRKHGVVVNLVGGSVVSVEEATGASEFELRNGGLRSGRMSVSVNGRVDSVQLSVVWLETKPGEFRVIEIYRAKPFSQDALIWRAE